MCTCRCACTRGTRQIRRNSSGTSDAGDDEKPQHMERTAGSANDAKLQPSDTTGYAGSCGMQGGIVVPLCAGHSVHPVEW